MFYRFCLYRLVENQDDIRSQTDLVPIFQRLWRMHGLTVEHSAVAAAQVFQKVTSIIEKQAGMALRYFRVTDHNVNRIDPPDDLFLFRQVDHFPRLRSGLDLQLKR